MSMGVQGWMGFKDGLTWRRERRIVCSMKLLVKAFAVVLAALAFVAPLAETAHCDGDHVDKCATECACACGCITVLVCTEQASDLTARESERACSYDMLCLGRLSIADIFRPPISA